MNSHRSYLHNIARLFFTDNLGKMICLLYYFAFEKGFIELLFALSTHCLLTVVSLKILSSFIHDLGLVALFRAML